MNEINGPEILRYFIGRIVDFMNITLTWGEYTFTLWEVLTGTIVISISAYSVGRLMNKDD